VSTTLLSSSSAAPPQSSPCLLAPERDSQPAGRAPGLVAAVSSVPLPIPPAVLQGRRTPIKLCQVQPVKHYPICHGLLQESTTLYVSWFTAGESENKANLNSCELCLNYIPYTLSNTTLQEEQYQPEVTMYV